MLPCILVAALTGAETLPPLVVDATSEPAESRTRAPGNDLAIGREAIEETGGASVAELLEQRAGLPFQSFFGTPGLGSPVLRGFAEGASQRTLILIDGLPVSRPDLGNSELLGIPMEGLERVELMRGSRTVRYGSAALAGVIALETRRAEGRFAGSGEHAFGDDATRRQRLSLAVPAGDWEIGLHGEHQETGGWRENSASESSGGQLLVRSPAGLDLRGQWNFAYHELFFENPGSLSRADYEGDPRQSFFTNFGVADQYFFDIETRRAAQTVEWEMNERLRLELRSGWSEVAREINFGAGSHSDNQLESWNFESVLAWADGPAAAELGLRWQRDDLEIRRFAEIERTTPLGVAAISRETLGAFALGGVDLGREWRLTGGAGWETTRLGTRVADEIFPDDPVLNFDERRGDEGYSFEIGLERRLGDDWTLWSRYDRTYRFPLADEVAGYQGFQLAEAFNRELEAEKGHNLEVGVRGGPEPLEFSLSGFAQWLEGEIAYDPGRNLNVNFADTRRVGIESRLAWEGGWWRGEVYYNGVTATFRSGEFEGRRVPLVPRHTVGGTLTWRPAEEVEVTLGALHVGASPEGNDLANSAEPLPGRTVWNAGIRWQLDPALSLFCRADNLFDRRHASLKYAGQYYPAAGRQVIAGCRWSF